LNTFSGDWFEQIIDAVHLECLDGIFIIGRCENDGAGDFNKIEYPEGRSVGNVDIHKNQVRLRMSFKP